tara:strand:+ start:122 stop:565 length:444 start_codon:yes stop_codon:yes gene_type:complete
MIITCPSCQKKFKLDNNLLPENGRTLQCGSCDYKWFFKKKDKDVIVEKPLELTQTKDEVVDEIKVNLETTLPQNTQEKQIVDNGLNISLLKIFNYFIVLIITVIAAIIFLDTFKNNLSSVFPNLELFLYNLFETIKDINLFIKDLIK